ncbi:hypothetical protein D3C78_20460 [compost metagenome]
MGFYVNGNHTTMVQTPGLKNIIIEKGLSSAIQSFFGPEYDNNLLALEHRKHYIFKSYKQYWELFDSTTQEMLECSNYTLRPKDAIRAALQFGTPIKYEVVNGVRGIECIREKGILYVTFYTGGLRHDRGIETVLRNKSNNLVKLNNEEVPSLIEVKDLDFAMPSSFVLVDKTDETRVYHVPDSYGHVIVALQKLKNGSIKVSSEFIEDVTKKFVNRSNFANCEVPFDNQGLWTPIKKAEFAGRYLFIAEKQIAWFINIHGVWVETTENWIVLFASKEIQEEYTMWKSMKESMSHEHQLIIGKAVSGNKHCYTPK